MSRREDIQKLLRRHHLRLQKLEEKEALSGFSVDPQILIEIENIKAKIRRLRAELKALENADVDEVSDIASSKAGRKEPEKDTPDEQRKRQFKEKIRRYLKRAGYTQADIARKLENHDPSTISKYITGERTIPYKTLERICDLIGVSESERRELFTLAGHGDEPPVYSEQINVSNESGEEQLQKLRENYLVSVRNICKGLDLSRILTPPDVRKFVEAPFETMFALLEVEELTEGQLLIERGITRESGPEDKTKDKTVDTSNLPEDENLKQEEKLAAPRQPIKVGLERKELLSIQEILAAKRFVILGDVGTGKSTLLRYIAFAIARGDYDSLGNKKKRMLPILIDIKDYVEVSGLGLQDYICQLDNRKYESLIREELKEGNCVVLLDGLDEVLNVAYRDKVIRQILVQASQSEENCYVVTSRPTGYSSTLLVGTFHQGYICDLEEKSIQFLANAWYEKLLTIGLYFPVSEM